MKQFSVWYRNGGRTSKMRFLTESFEQARERVIVFKSGTEDEPRIHCFGDATPPDELAPASQDEAKPAAVADEREHA